MVKTLYMVFMLFFITLASQTDNSSIEREMEELFSNVDNTQTDTISVSSISQSTDTLSPSPIDTNEIDNSFIVEGKETEFTSNKLSIDIDTNSIKIKFPQTIKKPTVEIISLKGEIIKSTTFDKKQIDTEFDISDIKNSGIYVLRITDTANLSFKKSYAIDIVR